MPKLSPRRAAAVAAAGALLLVGAAPAAAAPDRSAEVGPGGPTYKYTTGEKGGFVYTSAVSRNVPACTPMLFDCDQTLIEVKEPASKLVFKITGQASDTFKDVDLHVHRSDATGAKGALLGESTSAALDESVQVSSSAATPGYYLVYLDWYFGYGKVDGTVTFTPKPVAP